MKSLQSRLFLSTIQSGGGLPPQWEEVGACLAVLFPSSVEQVFYSHRTGRLCRLPLIPWGPADAPASCTQLAYPLPA